MGYTHYWDYQDYGPGWPLLVKDAQRIFEAAKEHGTELTGRTDEAFSTKNPIADVNEGIYFNGADDHDDFIFEKMTRGFNCCKTARKEYDWVVCLVLLRAMVHGDVEVSSDGKWDDDEWQFAKEMHEKLWPDEKVINPFEEPEDDKCEVCSFD